MLKGGGASQSFEVILAQHTEAHIPLQTVHGQCENFTLGTQCNLYSIASRWGFALGVMQILATNMFVSPTPAVLRHSGI